MYGLVFNSDSILKLLNDFNMLTNAYISFVSFDYRYVVALPESKSRFCNCLRKDKIANKKCNECDRKAYETVQRSGELYIYECHAGLTEAISPMIDDGKLVGYLFMGKVLREKPSKELWNKIVSKCRDYNIDYIELEKSFFKTTYMKMEEIQAAARIMDMSAKYICLSKMAKIRTSLLVENIKDYIVQNMEKKISTNELAKHFNVSQSHLCHTFKKEQNMPISKYILMIRINKACELLEKTDLSIKQIAEYIGLNEQNFFARIFKKSTGYTPTKYRTFCKIKA